MFGTNITSTEILMCTPNLIFQNFEFKGEEFQSLKEQAMNRVEQYYIKKKWFSINIFRDLWPNLQGGC